MSESMERHKMELMTAKEREEEEEEMKRELIDMKMYETWHTYKDMKQILGFINESKDMANMANDEKNTHKELKSSNECTPEMMMKTNLGQQLEIQEHSDMSRSKHSYRSNRMSPILDRISTQSCSSPEPTTSATDSRNSVHRNKNLDNDDMLDRLHDNVNTKDNYSHPNSTYILSKSKNSLQEFHGVHNTEAKMDTHSEREIKLKPWQIDPLSSLVNKNDVPLRQPDRPAVQDRMPFKLYKDAKTPEAIEKLLLALNIHLKETAELWHSWHRSTDSKFQWGSPIQVGHARGSSDKNILTSSKTEQDQMECTKKCNNERPNKRKSALTISSNVRRSSSDEDEKIVKKKKIQFYEGTSRVLRSHKDASILKQANDADSDSDFAITGNNEVGYLEADPEKNCKEPSSPELLPVYPRRIIPPNPRKNLHKKKLNTSISTEAISLRRSNEEQSAITLAAKEEDSSILTDQEILIELEKDSNEGNIKSTSENVEIKPLPVKGLSLRIKNQCKLLEKIQVEEQRKVEIEKEEAQRKENEEKRKREEFYKQQIGERQQKERQKLEREKLREEKSKRWNNVVTKKNNEEDKEKLRGSRARNQNTVVDITGQDSAQESSNFRTNTIAIVDDDLIGLVNCPICNRSFPSDRIEVHAAECEQYVTDNEDEEADVNSFKNKNLLRKVNNAQVFECNICSKYKTTNGMYYEEHVNSCLQRQKQSESLSDCTNIEINDIPTSPIRCYRSISEQTDSEIDYRRQFPSNSRSQQVHSKRKRKH